MPDADTRFAMPAVDDPPTTEVGVILMGFDAERLLAGLGMTALVDDPGQVALAVDQVRHGIPLQVYTETLVAAGRARWLAVRDTLRSAGAHGGTSGAPRQAWAQALRLVEAAALPGAGPAARAYLAACWLRRAALDHYLTRGNGVPPSTTTAAQIGL